LARRGSHHVYNTIPKSKEWLIINYVVNAIRGSLPRFYIFRGYTIKENYIKHCKEGTCMVINAPPNPLLDSKESNYVKGGNKWDLVLLPASNTKGGERGVLKAPGLD
jgi:hypothetical protein